MITFNKIIKESKLERFFNLYFILILYYYSYRYILKYNFSGTSPTYADTPIQWQVAKYIILVGIITWYIAGNLKINISGSNRLISTLIILLVAQGIIAGILSASSDYVGFAILLVPSLFFLNQRYDLVNKAEKILLLFFVFFVIYEFIQIVLFETQGRLPALAYATGKITDVRFGGSWDDPNCFSLVFAFYIPYFIVKTNKIKRIALLVLSSIMLLITWSLTGFFSCILGILISGIVLSNDKKIKNRLWFVIFMVVVVTAVIVLINYDYIKSTFDYFLIAKQGSISNHLDFWSMDNLGILTVMGISPINTFSEVGFLRLIYMGGIIALIAYFALVGLTLKKIKRNESKSREYNAFWLGTASYIIAFTISQINLPNIYNFSSFGFFVALIMVVTSFRKRTCRD